MSNKQTHWFYIEPYSYISYQKNYFIAYNTLNGEFFESEVIPEMKSFIESIVNPDN